MSKQQKFFPLRVVLVTVIFLSTWLITPTPRAYAIEPGATGWAYWLLNVTFPAPGVVNALWTVHVEYSDPAKGILINSEVTEPIPCTPSGAVTIESGRALFNRYAASPGSIACAMPSFAAKVATITSGVWTLPAVCSPNASSSGSSSSLPIRRAWVNAQVVPLSSSGNNPIFYHPSIGFNVLRPVSGNAEMNFRLDSTVLHSNPFAYPALPPQLWAGSNAVPAGVSATYDFKLNGTSIGTTGTLPLFDIETNALTVYIGSNPTTGEYYHGEMNWVIADPSPGCREGY